MCITCWCVDGFRVFLFFSSRRRHTRFKCDWSSDVCSSDLADLAQIDMRAIAGLSQDPDYIAVFNDPCRDLHSEIAAGLWGGPMIGNPLREKAKPMGHGSNYGMGPEKLAANAGVTEAEAVQFQRMVDRMFPGK